MSVVENIKLNKFEDLFMGSDTSSTVELPISELHSFVNHPFKVLENDDMAELVNSIKQNGVINPIIVRTTDDGYEIIAGHRRTYASKVAGLKTIPAIVKDNISDDEAIIYMVDSNIARETILPSEKAFSYKMKQEAIKHQGKIGSRTNDLIGEQFGDSGRQVQRYIRLTNLISPLIEFVDNNKIKLIPAVELSYLDEKSQIILYQYIDDNEKYPSLKQAKEIKEYYNANNNIIDANIITEIMETKNHGKTKNKLPKEFTKYFDDNMTEAEIEGEIAEILKEYFLNGRNSN